MVASCPWMLRCRSWMATTSFLARSSSVTRLGGHELLPLPERSVDRAGSAADQPGCGTRREASQWPSSGCGGRWYGRAQLRRGGQRPCVGVPGKRAEGGLLLARRDGSRQQGSVRRGEKG